MGLPVAFRQDGWSFAIVDERDGKSRIEHELSCACRKKADELREAMAKSGF